MAQTILLTGTIATTERDASAALSVRVQSDSATQHELTGTVTGEAAAINALGARDRVIRWDLQVDLGGGLASLPPREFKILTISEHIEEWADTLEFELHGNKYSPLIQAATRGLVPVTAYVEMGTLSAPITRQRFKGYMSAVRWDHQRRVLTVTALDEAAKHAEKIVAPSVDPSDEKKRDSYAIELLQANSVTVGTISLGTNGNKTIKKPISQIDVRLLDWLRDYLAPCGAWVYFVDGKFHATKYTPTGPVSKALYPSDIISISSPIVPPPAPSTNKYTAVTVNYEKTTPGGEYTKETTTQVFSTYAVQGATAKQVTPGSTTSVSYSDSSSSLIETSRVVTRQTFRGDILVRSEIVERGYYSPMAARLQLETDGTTVNNLSSSTRYQYADGTWRLWSRERFVPIRITVTSKTFDDNNYVVGIQEDRYFWRFVSDKALFQVSGGSDTFNGVQAIPITEGGEGVTTSYERFGGISTPGLVTQGYGVRDEQIVTVIDLDEDGFITKQTESTYQYTRGAKRNSSVNNAYGYGLNNREYWSSGTGTTFQSTVARVLQYDPIGEETYSIIESLTSVGALKSGGDDVQVRASTGTGSRPRPEQLLDTTTSQEIRQSAEDSVRVALSGTYEDFLENEFCQDDEDLGILANTALREASAWPIAVTIPIEWVLHKGSYITLNGFTADGIDGLRCFVAGIRIDAQAKTQSLDLRYYPPEVADVY